MKLFLLSLTRQYMIAAFSYNNDVKERFSIVHRSHLEVD